MGAARPEVVAKMKQTNPITIANSTFFLSMFLPPFLVLTLHLKQHLDNTSLMKRFDPDNPSAEIFQRQSFNVFPFLNHLL
jgi:hypothetical protein